MAQDNTQEKKIFWPNKISITERIDMSDIKLTIKHEMEMSWAQLRKGHYNISY